jgi:hypothetical protein
MAGSLSAFHFFALHLSAKASGIANGKDDTDEKMAKT